jgi:hypothetical protein
MDDDIGKRCLERLNGRRRWLSLRLPVINVVQILVVMMGIVDLMIAMVMNMVVVINMVVVLSMAVLMKMLMQMRKPKEILPGITMETSGLG